MEYAGPGDRQVRPVPPAVRRDHRRRLGRVERGFFDYAIKDPIVTLAAYEAMAREAIASWRPTAMIRPDALERFGPARARRSRSRGPSPWPTISRRGMRPGRRAGSSRSERGLRRRLDELVADLSDDARAARACSAADRDGRARPDRRRDGPPACRQDRLRETARRRPPRRSPRRPAAPSPIPRTEKGKRLAGGRGLGGARPVRPVRRAPGSTWARRPSPSSSSASSTGAVVHPQYTTLVRTGRTSCSRPNVQHLPRKGGFREAFVALAGPPLPDRRLLASSSCGPWRRVCEARYGRSSLADVIRDGVDPHCYTAAMFEGMDLDEFMGLAGERGSRRSRAVRRPCGSGPRSSTSASPAAWGRRSLVAYARSTYGVELTLEEAAEFRHAADQRGLPRAGPLPGRRRHGRPGPQPRRHGPRPAGTRFDRQGDRSGAVAGGIRNVVAGQARARPTGRPTARVSSTGSGTA